MKFVIFVLLMFSASCTKSEPPKAEAPAKFDSVPLIKIVSGDRICTTDADCGHVMTQCSCGCGEGVTSTEVKKYENILRQVCENYQGIMCKVVCNGAVKCIGKVCTYVRK